MKKLLLILLTTSSLLSNSQVSRVSDFYPSSTTGGLNNTFQLGVVNNSIIFSAISASTPVGTELYIYDGINIPYLLKDISTSGSSFPQRFFYSNTLNTVFFSANDSPTNINQELWKTDGTASGTTNVIDTNISGSGNPKNFVNFNNELYFQSTLNSGSAVLHHSDGTTSGTSSLSSSIVTFPKNFTTYNGDLYFSGLSSSDRELWKTDGTQAGTVLVKNINSSGSSIPEQLIVYNNKLYFVADNGINGKELWESDGTTNGTILVSDYNPGAVGSNPTDLTIYKGRLYFSAITATNGREIHVVGVNDNIILFRDLVFGAVGSNPEKFFYYSSANLLLFVAGNGNNNRELWYTNGSLLGTNQLKDINPGSSSSNPNSLSSTFFIEYNNRAYFTADDGTNGIEVWSTDGTTSGTELLTDIRTGGNIGSNPRSFVVANDLLFFIANDTNGYELWKYQDPTLSLNEIELTNIKLFPNPTTNYFSISTNQFIGSISIYDIRGKEVKIFKRKEPLYDISKLTSGIYILKIKTNKGVTTKKLIKK